MAYVICISDMNRLVIEIGIDATFSVLAEAKKSYGPFVSPFLTTQVEHCEASLKVGKD